MIMIADGTREAFDRYINNMRKEKLEAGEGTNLLQETIENLASNNKTPKDVLCVVRRDCKATWKDFAELADFEYDAGYGCAEIDSKLYVVGKDWWLERHEYDGSEWWEFKTIPTIPQDFTHSLVIRGEDSDNEFAVKPKTEEDMIALIKRHVFIKDKDSILTAKEYLKNIKWFYDKYRLLFDGD